MGEIFSFFLDSSLSVQIIMFIILLGIPVTATGLYFLFKGEFFLSEIENCLKQKKFKQAVDHGLQYLKKHPDNAMAYFYIAQGYEGLNQMHPAIESYEKALVSMAQTGAPALKNEILVKLGELYYSLGRLENAQGYFLMVLKNNSKSPKTLMNLARVYHDLGKTASCREMLEKYIAYKPGDSKAHYMLARIYNQAGEYQKSINSINQFYESSDNVPLAQGNETIMIMADNYFALKRFKDAYSTLRPLLSDKKVNGKLIIKSFLCLVNAGELDKAEKLLNEQIYRLTPKDRCEVLYEAAKSYFSQNYIYQALELWKAASAINPKYLDLSTILARYDILIQYPALKAVFTHDDEAFETLIIQRFHIISGNNFITQNRSHWIVKDSQKCAVINREPFPIELTTFNSIEDSLKVFGHANLSIEFYSLYGVAEDCKKSLFFKRILEITGDDFVSFFLHGNVPEKPL